MTSLHVRRGGGYLLIALSVLLIGFGAIAGWLRVELLSTDRWVETSRETLHDPEVQAALTLWATDELMAATDPQNRLEAALPKQLDLLAAPLASYARDATSDGIARALQSEAAERAWVTTNRRAHERFVDVVNNNDPLVVTRDNGLVLDLRPLLTEIGEKVGANEQQVERVAARIGVVEPKRSEELVRFLEVLRVLDRSAPWLVPLGILSLLGGLWLTMGRRRRAVMGWALGIAAAGVALGTGCTELGPVIADLLTEVTTWNAAVLSTWGVVSEYLAAIGDAMTIIGIITFVGAWVGGGGPVARSIRGRFGPIVHTHRFVAWAALVALSAVAIRNIDALGILALRTQFMVLVLAMLGAAAIVRELSRPDAPTAA